MRRGSHGSKNMCPYCGGMHPAAECPMMMYPPAMPMPMPYMPMPSMPMPPMGGMGGMPMGQMPMGGMMPGMQEHMARVEQMLHEIHQCCMETNAIVKEIHMNMAKG